jgi:peptidoglycan/LPS O-acetylase OafA/YrhL
MSSVAVESPIEISDAILPVHSPSLARIAQLDGLRGVAIAMVVLYHYFSFHLTTSDGTLLWYLLYPTRFGWSGVDLFFVLSGFLIGGILLDAKGSRNYFQVFYIRRFLRIVPIYYLFLILFFSFIAWFGVHPSPCWPWKLGENLPRYTYFLFFQNIWAAIYGVLGSTPLAVCWSLSVEEQFYLTLPLLIRFFSRERIRFLAVEIILLAPVLRIALYSFCPSHPHFWYLLMPCRADSLFFGVLGAILLRDPAWRIRIERNRSILRLVVILLAIGVPFVTQAQMTARGLVMVSLMFSWLAAFYLSVLIYSLTFTMSRVSRMLNWTLLRGLGVIAYGVYLFHQGILDFILRTASLGTKSLAVPYLLVALSAMAVTICLAYLSWEKFEKPFVRFSHRYKYEQL